jgi:hypothetical protein
MMNLKRHAVLIPPTEEYRRPCCSLAHAETMLFLNPEGAKLVQKYLGRTWAAFLTTALIGGGIGKPPKASVQFEFICHF